MNKFSFKVDEKQLIQQITSNTIPVGETNHDKDVLENIHSLINIIDAGVNALDCAINTRDKGEHSIVICKDRAKTYMRNLKDYLVEEAYRYEE